MNMKKSFGNQKHLYDMGIPKCPERPDQKLSPYHPMPKATFDELLSACDPTALTGEELDRWCAHQLYTDGVSIKRIQEYYNQFEKAKK